MAVSIQFLTSGAEQVEAAAARVDRSLDAVGRSMERHSRILDKTLAKAKSIGRDQFKGIGMAAASSFGTGAIASAVASGGAGDNNLLNTIGQAGAALGGFAIGERAGMGIGGTIGAFFGGPAGAAAGAGLGGWIGGAIGTGFGVELGNLFFGEEKKKEEDLRFPTESPVIQEYEARKEAEVNRLNVDFFGFQYSGYKLKRAIRALTFTDFFAARLDPGHVSPYEVEAMQREGFEDRGIGLNLLHQARVARQNRSTFKKPFEVAY